MVYIRVSKLKHYKLLTSNNDNFLINVDGNIMNTIFPVFLWSFSQKAYKISNEQALELELKNRKEVNFQLITGIMILLSLLAKFLLPIVEALVIDTPFLVSIIILLLSFVACIFIKLYKYKENKKSLSNIINLNECRSVRIKLLKEKRYIKSSIKLLCFSIFLLLMLFFTSYVYIEFDNYFAVISFIFCTYLYLFLNTLIFPLASIKGIEVIDILE